MTFGKVLQALRDEVGISQSELAARSGVSLDSLRNWEQDRTIPRIDVATRLARALGVSLDRLAVEAEPAAPPEPKRGRPAKPSPEAGDAGGAAAPTAGEKKKPGRPKKA